MLLLIIAFICPFYFLSNKTFYHRICSSYYSESLQILYTLWEGPSILWERKPRFCDYFVPSFSISHSNVIHREICVKDSSGTTVPEILKFGTKWVWLVVLCKRESAYCCLSFSLFFHFSFSPSKFSITNFLASMRARVFKIFIHIESG